MKKKVASLGWFGHKNCGDEMFKEALAALFPDLEFSFYSSLQNINEINKNSFLFIGGGNIVDEKFLKGLDKVKIPYSFIGVGITEKESLPLFSGATQVFLRDVRSKGLYTEGTLIPDIGFSMTPNRDKGLLLLDRMGVKRDKPLLGLYLNDCVNTNFNSTLLKQTELRKFVLEMARYLDGLPYNIVFIPMSFAPPDDRRISLEVIGNMKKGYRTHLISSPISPQDCLDITAALDMAITMRLHAAIFCTIGNTPFMDITHHSKNRSYLETEGLDKLSIDYYEISLRSLDKKFKEIESDSGSVREELFSAARKNKHQLYEIIQNVHIP